jgi:hypothetical protein
LVTGGRCDSIPIGNISIVLYSEYWKCPLRTCRFLLVRPVASSSVWHRAPARAMTRGITQAQRRDPAPVVVVIDRGAEASLGVAADLAAQGPEAYDQRSLAGLSKHRFGFSHASQPSEIKRVCSHEPLQSVKF